ncbi:MAG: HNH endonuclease [Chloroflexi bacterium]|nr:HNH endonuclease [Chloroflexota bacterium]
MAIRRVAGARTAGSTRSGAAGVAMVGRDGDRVLWWSDGGCDWADPELAAADVELLLWNRRRRRDAQLERRRTTRLRADAVESARRERIPDEVRSLAWESDAGRCVRCGAGEDLQFDHVIADAKGGNCNRAKDGALA